MAATPAPARPASGKPASRRPRAHHRWNPMNSCCFAAADRPQLSIEFPWCGVLRPNLADGERNLGLACVSSTNKAMPTNESNVTLTLSLASLDQQRALGLKRSKLRRIAEPSPTVFFG